MAKKPTVTTVSSGFASNTQLNANFTALRDAFDNTLSLDGSTPNAMQADLDLNGNALLNVGTIDADVLVVAGTNLNTQVANAAASASASAASAIASANSAASADSDADRAEIARDDAQGVLDDRLRRDVATLLADTTLTYTAGQPGTVVAGDIVRTREEGFAYEVAASGATIITAVNPTGYHIATAGGVKLFALPDGAGRISAAQLGVVADGVTNWEASFSARMVALYTLSAQPGLCVVWPGGDYATSMNLGNSYNGSRMHFEGARFYGILHLIDNITNVIWTGDVASYDRLGLQGCTNTVLPEKIRMLYDPAKNSASTGIGNRGVHFLTCSNIEWGEIIVDDTGPTQAAAPGAQTIWAGLAIQSGGLRGFRGRVHVKNASGHGVHINALDLDMDIQVDGYGKSAIDFSPGSFLQNTDSEAQSEQGCGVWFNRCTGRVRVRVGQSNVSPLSDVYSVLFDETGISTISTARHEALVVEQLIASVGNGNRGVCIGETLAPSPVCNVSFPNGVFITMRTANTLAAGLAAFNVNAPSAVSQSYRLVKAAMPIEFWGFTTQPAFRAVAASATDNYTELDISTIKTRQTGAGRFIQLDGTGGVLRGRIGRVDVFYNAGSSAVPVIDVDSCENFVIETGNLLSASPVNTTAVRFVNCVDSEISIPVIYNLGRSSPDGGFKMQDLTRCAVRNVFMDRSVLAQIGFLFEGTLTDCTFEGLQATNFGDGFSVVGTPTFTDCVAIRCKATGNTDDTDVTLAMFPAANQLVCTNFAV